MKLKKNAAAKVGAVIASIAGLLGFWGIVHQNPPPSTAAAAVVDAATPAPNQTSSATNRRTSPSTPATPVAPKRHTRTRAS